MSEVKPALTRGEWDEFFAVSNRDYIDETERGMKINAVRRSMADAALNARRYNAAAALALYGQPSGFTWEDVDRLRALHEAAAAPGMDELADRISSLLPPRR